MSVKTRAIDRNNIIYGQQKKDGEAFEALLIKKYERAWEVLFEASDWSDEPPQPGEGWKAATLGMARICKEAGIIFPRIDLWILEREIEYRTLVSQFNQIFPRDDVHEAETKTEKHKWHIEALREVSGVISECSEQLPLNRKEQQRFEAAKKACEVSEIVATARIEQIEFFKIWERRAKENSEPAKNEVLQPRARKRASSTQVEAPKVTATQIPRKQGFGAHIHKTQKHKAGKGTVMGFENDGGREDDAGAVLKQRCSGRGKENVPDV
ncbi:hypothetical protein LIA77_02204 [Sarocladium implicatum]|nr:hypothetical protein LIA77_02204 [Sarocladium implicatum]